MIHLCTPAIGSSKSSGRTVSCNCGERPAVDGKKSISCVLSTVLELSSLIDSDFTWTKVSKGCRSSSTRPRGSNTIGLDCGELFSKGFKGLEMPVSESEKLGVSILGCHFGEKAEHIPIKKRRFLIRASSPPCNDPNLSLGVAERHATSPKASCHGLLLNPNANCLPTVSEGAHISGIGSNDEKLDVKKLVKDDDFSGISILAAAACSNSLGAEADHSEGSGIVSSVNKNHEISTAAEVNEQELKVKESDPHMSTTPFKVDESTCNNSASQAPLELAFSKTNQDPSIQKSPVRDARFSWDLNTVMDAWEEPILNEHEVSAPDVANDNDPRVEEKKNGYTKDISESKSQNISCQNLSIHLKSLVHENEELKLGKCEPFSCGFGNAQHAMAVKTELKNIDNVDDTIPVTRNLTVENSTHGNFSRWVNFQSQSPSGFGSAEVDTKLSMDCSVPPGFDHCLTLHSSKENVGFSPTIVDSTATATETVMPKHDLSLASATSSENGPLWREVTFNKVDDEAMTKMELTTNVVAVENMVIKEEADKEGLKPVDQITFGAQLVGPSSVMVEDQPAAISFMHDAARSDAEAPLENGFGYANLQSDNRAGYGVDKQDELSVGYDSQYEDGELRESSMHAWKGCELNNEEYEYDMENREDDYNLRVVDPRETSSQNGQGGSSGMVNAIEAGFGREADLTSNLVLPEKLNSSDGILSGSVPNEKSNGQENRERQHIVQNANHSEWKMNVSGWDILPENQRISSNNFAKTRNFTGRKFFYGEQKDRFETGDVEMRAEGSRFYQKESLTRIAGPSTRDEYVGRDRFRMQGCSSKADDGFTPRPERESDRLRSFGRGRYSPHHRSSGRGAGMWNRSPERGRDPKRLSSPSYQGPSFARSMLEDSRTVDNIANEGGMDSSRRGRSNTSSYVTRRPFRSRSPLNREAQDFRARLGLRPSGDTGHDRFVNLGRGRGRGRSVRYGTLLDDEGPRGRYNGPADECDEYLTEYPRPFPRRRRCFSPIERRGNTSYQHHQSNSRSPSRPRTRSPIGNTGFRRRSRSPDFRHDTRIRRPRSPNCRDHANDYNSGPRNNNSSPMSSRWVNYKDRPVFDRRSPPPGRTNAPQGERFSFYDSRKKQNEYYRSGHPGHFSDLKESGRSRPRYVGNDSDRPDNGYRRGGFVRRYNMDTPTKRFHFDEDELGRGFDARDQHALELLARENLNSDSSPKPSSNGTDSRFRDFPRRVREDSDLKRRSREGKDPKESEHTEDDLAKHPKEDKDQSTTTTSTTNLDSMPNEAVKGDDIKTNVGP
uniref:uncharacterized protein LOC122585473 n=1 Tax=Erigeron canadensis TaxID=72917 RepID=UPI001CB8BBA8|nr:uncharacterized protein LOC122585473 [Erigeron canadensis]XP_043613538.1 uncharacterized protein LOC122585473 [Erigeron canadensis]